MGFGDNTLASIITRGLAETARLGVQLGADPLTFAGLAGLGDLVATCTSPLSRNRTFGERLGRGESLEQAQEATHGQVAEGVKSCRSVLELAQRHGVEVPITAGRRGGLLPRHDAAADARAADVALDEVRELSAYPPVGSVGVERIRVAVVYGGRSSEHGISVVSAGSVLAALDPERYEVVPVGITPAGPLGAHRRRRRTALQITGRTLPQVGDGRRRSCCRPTPPAPVAWCRSSRAPRSRRSASVDVVFPVLHGRFGEDGTIQGLLEMAGVPYVGAGRVRQRGRAWTRSSPRSCCARRASTSGASRCCGRAGRGRRSTCTSSGLPVFVKPARAGSSVGITKVTDWADLPDAIEAAFAHDTKVLVEAAVVGREIECGVLEDADGRPEASVPGRDPARRRPRLVRLRGQVPRRRLRVRHPAGPAGRGDRRRAATPRAARSTPSTAPAWPGSTSSSRPTTG